MERFLLACMGLFVLALIFNTIKNGLKDIERFDNMLGGILDLRPGSMGSTSPKTAGAWIQAATFSLTSAYQEIDIVLEVYGPGRQTFLLTVANDSSKSTVSRFMHMNHFGASSTVFSSGYLTSSGSGLTTTKSLFLQMSSDNCNDIPIVWYLKGVGISDTFAVQNVSSTVQPSGGTASQVLDSSGGVSTQMTTLSNAVAALQNQVNNVQSTANSANSNAASAINRINTGPSTCRWLSTPMNDVGPQTTIYLDRHTPGEGCASNETLREFHFTRNGAGDQFRYDYLCCRM